MEEQNTIVFDHVEKIYQKNKVIEDLNLIIPGGQRLILLGPSGCGKSTTLRMIAGLEEISGGELRMGDRRVNEVPSGKRDISMVFQNYALYPHMTVRENITYALRVHKLDQQELNRRLQTVLEILGLDPYIERKPRELSGGQRQRVALARSVCSQSPICLMDEPLSNLDAKLRGQMRNEIRRLQKKLGLTVIYVTHDQVEAMTMGDYIAVMDKGVIMQYGTPDEIYSDPQNIFTARFIGDPGMNIATRPDGAFWGFRSARASFRKPDGFDGISFSGAISTRERLGDIYHYTIQSETGDEFAVRNAGFFDYSQRVELYIQKEHLYAFDAQGNRVPDFTLPAHSAG